MAVAAMLDRDEGFDPTARELVTPMGRALHLGLAVASALMLVACDTTVAGDAVRAPDPTEPDGAVIAQMNTGAYPTTPGRPYGTAGDDLMLQATLEGHRLGPFVAGPWQVDETLVDQPAITEVFTGPLSGPEMLRTLHIVADPMVDIAAAHGFFSGFDSIRTSREGGQHALLNLVLEFPDAGAATAAATELAVANVPPLGGPPGVPVPVPYHPELVAMSYDNPDGSTTVQTAVARGPVVLFAAAHTGPAYPNSAITLAQGLAGVQERMIDGFVPTAPDKRAALPLDPTGALLARTLTGPGDAAPFIVGVWEPRAWLHFEDNPVKSAALFNAAGVEVVTQRLTTVYQTHNADGAQRVVDAFAADMGATTDVAPAAGVPGLPAAKCFVRNRGAEPPTSAISWRRVAWRYKCVGRADKYAFTAFSSDDADVHQQMAAQYRILAGK
jgi:hypothetical protein